MPIPERFRAPRVSKTIVEKLSQLCDEIENGVNRGEDVSLLLETWHCHAQRTCEPHEFTTYYGSMTKQEFVKSALIAFPGSTSDATYQECKAIASALMSAEVRHQADQAYYLSWLDSNFPGGRISDLMFWPNEWFGDDSYFLENGQFLPDRELSVDQILRYAMLRSGRILPDAPGDVTLPLPLPSA
jgi:hypothetical protein